MGAITRTKDDIDVFERTMQGVHTSENRRTIIIFHSDRGIVGLRTRTAIGLLDDTPAEREVIVKMPRRHTR